LRPRPGESHSRRTHQFKLFKLLKVHCRTADLFIFGRFRVGGPPALVLCTSRDVTRGAHRRARCSIAAKADESTRARQLPLVSSFLVSFHAKGASHAQRTPSVPEVPPRCTPPHPSSARHCRDPVTARRRRRAGGMPMAPVHQTGRLRCVASRLRLVVSSIPPSVAARWPRARRWTNLAAAPVILRDRPHVGRARHAFATDGRARSRTAATRSWCAPTAVLALTAPRDPRNLRVPRPRCLNR